MASFGLKTVARDTDEMRTKGPFRGQRITTHMTERITEDWLKKQTPPATGAATLWDLEITGFGVRIFAPTKRHATGARSFFINYRMEGREKRFTIGSYPDWSAAAARAEAKELRLRIDRGEDPTKERRDRREAPTVRDLAQRYREEHLPKKAASSQTNDWAMIQNEILPAIGDRKVADVHEGDIEALHRGITERGRAVRANRVLAVASKMFSLALRRKEGEDAPWRNQAQGNPCKGAARNPEEGHERFFSPAELAALSDALATYGQTPAADCLRFIMLTGCRPGEAIHATWDQFAAEPGFWVKPSAHTKQPKVHRVPLAAAAAELLERIKTQREKNSSASSKRLRVPRPVARPAAQAAPERMGGRDGDGLPRPLARCQRPQTCRAGRGPRAQPQADPDRQRDGRSRGEGRR